MRLEHDVGAATQQWSPAPSSQLWLYTADRLWKRKEKKSSSSRQFSSSPNKQLYPSMKQTLNMQHLVRDDLQKVCIFAIAIWFKKHATFFVVFNLFFWSYFLERLFSVFFCCRSGWATNVLHREFPLFTKSNPAECKALLSCSHSRPSQLWHTHTHKHTYTEKEREQKSLTHKH